MGRFQCIECTKIYDENTVPDDYVCKVTDCAGNGLTGLIIPVEISNEENGQSVENHFVYTKECALCILLLNASEEMFLEPAFKGYSFPSQYGKKFYSKAELLSRIVAKSIFELRSMCGADHLYICTIKYDHRQSIIFNENVKNIITQYQTAENLARYLYNQLEEMKGDTDINSALSLAYSLIEKFKEGDIKEMKKFAPMYHSAYAARYNQAFIIPTVRVLIYTYGGQQREYNFAKDSFVDQRFSLLIGAYLGEVSDQGYRDLREILDTCLIHNEEQLFLIDSPKKLMSLQLRGLFDITEGVTGFCPKCLPGKTSLLR